MEQNISIMFLIVLFVSLLVLRFRYFLVGVISIFNFSSVCNLAYSETLIIQLRENFSIV